MKQNEVNILSPRGDSRTGLVSLEALERITAQLPTTRRTFRVSVVNCGNDLYENQTLIPEVATVGGK
jgi:hypothetical protein